MSKMISEKQSLINKQPTTQQPPPVAFKHKLKKVEGCGGFSHFCESSSCPADLAQVLPATEYKNLIFHLNKEIRSFRMRNAVMNLLALPIIFAAVLLTFYRMILNTKEFAIVIVAVFVLVFSLTLFNLYWNKKKIAKIAGDFNSKYSKQLISLGVTRHQKFRRNYKFKATILYTNLIQNQRKYEQQLNNYQQQPPQMYKVQQNAPSNTKTTPK